MKFVIRTDSSTKIGSGHLMRCLTLAEELVAAKCEVSFVCRDLKGNLIDLIKQKGFNLFSLPSLEDEFEPDKEVPHSHWLETNWKQDLRETQDALKPLGKVDWIIVDHYALDYKWEEGIKKSTNKILVIDDLADRRHDCDLLLDQNLYEEMEKRYKDLVPEKCKLLLGPRYALLRKEFREAKEKPRQRDGTIKRIFIFFGGVDPTNETEKTLRAINELNKPDLVVDLVVGSSNQNKERLQKLCAERPNTNFYCQVNNMATLMNEADLSIGAGGTTTWERCYLGLPSIVIPVARNQEKSVSILSDRGVLIALPSESDTWTLKNSINVLLSSSKELRQLSLNSLKIMEDNNILEVLREFQGSNISIREAGSEDSDFFFELFSDEVVRSNSFNPGKISIQEHRDWFSRKLNDDRTLLLVAESLLSKERFAQVRYEFERNEATISLSIHEKYRLKGLGKILLNESIKFLKNKRKISSIHAFVKAENLASCNLFLHNGFHQIEETNILNSRAFHFIKHLDNDSSGY